MRVGRTDEHLDARVAGLRRPLRVVVAHATDQDVRLVARQQRLLFRTKGAVYLYERLSGEERSVSVFLCMRD